MMAEMAAAQQGLPEEEALPFPAPAPRTLTPGVE